MRGREKRLSIPVLLLSGLLALFSGCHTTVTSPGSEPMVGNEQDSLGADAIEGTVAAWEPDDAVVDLFVVIADTGHSYAVLDRHMQRLASLIQADIDTMGRYYDPVRDSILLPIDDEDELYAGQYFPRRFEGNTLSIEYLDQYDTTAVPGTMALITGLWSGDQQADSALRRVRMHMPRAYRVRARLYQGCMH